MTTDDERNEPPYAVTTPERPALGRTILRNALFVSSGGGLIRLLTFAYTILYVRVLGESAYGQYATVLAFGALFGIFFELGTTQYVERTVAQDRTRLPELLWMLIITRLGLALAGVVLLPLIAMGVGYEPVLILCILLLSLTYLLAAVLAPLTAIFTSHERYDLWTICQVIGQVSSVALGATVLSLGGGLVALVTVGLVVMPLQILYCWVVIKRNKFGPLPFHFDARRIPAFLKASLPFALTSLALTVGFNVDTFLLSLLKTSNVVGWYSAAYRLVPTMVALLGGFLTVITPTLARVYVNDRERVHQWTQTSIKWLAMFSLPLAMGASLLAQPIINLLYGPAFAPAAVALAILAWDIPLRLFNAFAGNVTAASNLERTAWRIFMTGTLIGVVLYVPAILQFGILGAAVVTVLADGVNTVLFYRLIGREASLNRISLKLVMVIAATLVMGAIVWASSRYLILPVVVLTGAVVYGAAAWLLGLVDRSLVGRVTSLLSAGRHAS